MNCWIIPPKEQLNTKLTTFFVVNYTVEWFLFLSRVHCNSSYFSYIFFFSSVNRQHCLQHVCAVHITYLGHSLWTAGHPERLLHSRPSSGSLQISPQSSSSSSEGSPLGSTYSPDGPFCSTPPTNRSPSAGRRAALTKGRSCGDISGYSCNHFIELQSGFKATAVIIIRNIYVKLSVSVSHKSRL